MKIALSCFLLLLLLPNSTLLVSALSLDGAALLSLLRHWDKVPSSINLSWNASDSTPCSWIGVHCNNHDVVVAFNLSGFGISGQLGPEIAYIKHLKSVDLSYNSFSGSIPKELGDCSLLQSVELSYNSFAGRIPESFGDLPKLEYLSLWGNSLGGEIPESLFRAPILSTIYLNNNNLNGSIPSSIGNATRLEFLFLYNNQLSGTVPSTIGNCSSLQELYLNNNFLQGTLPDSLNNLEELVYLYVNDNNLTGRIPSGLGNCRELLYLILSDNQFTGGIPPELGNCSSLTNLAAVNCGLSGEIPASLGKLANLNLLYLSENHLSGTIPPELGNCRALIDLEIYDNQLEGEIPSELGFLTQLQILMLFTNHLSGEIPVSIWKIQSLQHVIVYQNNLVGELPNEITELKQLRNISLFENGFTGVIPQGLGINSSLMLLDLTRNKFSGPLPSTLCFRKQMCRLLLGYNQFQGSIPSDIGSCSSLTRLILRQNNLSGNLPEFTENPNLLFMDLSSNSISGSIPPSLGKLSNITFVDLSLNKFTGHIPYEMGNLAYLESLNLSSNGLEGVLPANLSRCYRLLKLDVSHNLLNGEIPSSLRSLMELSDLDLSGNHFGGGVPRHLFQLGKLSSLNLGGNQFGGSIPPSIGLEAEAQSLRSLNLSNNRLTGHVPSEVKNLKLLEQIDICCNNLSGNLEAFGELRALTKVNVSFNAFAGPVPAALMKFVRLNPSSFVGNGDLCINCRSSGEAMCQGNNTFKLCNQTPGKRGLKHIIVAVVVCGSFLAVVILGLGICYFFSRWKSHEQKNMLVSVEEGTSSLLNQVIEATENLNDRYIIGRGAHGVVYKVTLEPSKVYALKKLDFFGYDGGRTSLVREIQTIGKVRHRNLIKLEDFWLRKEHGLILYNYMPNGSLHDVLHKTRPPPLLEWDVRFKIVLGTAEGLSYLHFDCDPVIIHRDIKPMNILLDSEMEPHISDFGIAKLLDESAVSSVTQSSRVHGTIGYMAPEKAFSTRSSKESDVYAYGVVVLEVMTRKSLCDPLFGGSVDMVEWVRSVWQETEDIEAIVDSKLVDEFIDSSCSSSIKEQAKDVVVLALWCTEKDPTRRPSMRDVVNRLRQTQARARTRGK
ncbi:receptor-like protein kinase [Andrographis paniculata]|uniref:receptor-like protein kinase n=1 Tax=Andrographis paniculata TaxID=175694 RepID=UPI0021E889B9|nr:receptor-like protein kinase [Andrographis paniculata]